MTFLSTLTGEDIMEGAIIILIASAATHHTTSNRELRGQKVIPIAPVVLFVIHIGGATFVPFYDWSACEKARTEMRKLERSIVTKCVLTQTEKEPKL